MGWERERGGGGGGGRRKRSKDILQCNTFISLISTFLHHFNMISTPFPRTPSSAGHAWRVNLVNFFKPYVVYPLQCGWLARSNYTPPGIPSLPQGNDHAQSALIILAPLPSPPLPPPPPLSLPHPISSRSVSALSEKTPNYCMPSGKPRYLGHIFPGVSFYVSFLCLPSGGNTSSQALSDPPLSRNKRKFSSNQKKASFFGSIKTQPKPLLFVWPIPVLRNIIKKSGSPPLW